MTTSLIDIDDKFCWFYCNMGTIKNIVNCKRFTKFSPHDCCSCRPAGREKYCKSFEANPHSLWRNTRGTNCPSPYRPDPTWGRWALLLLGVDSGLGMVQLRNHAIRRAGLKCSPLEPVPTSFRRHQGRRHDWWLDSEISICFNTCGVYLPKALNSKSIFGTHFLKMSPITRLLPNPLGHSDWS